MDWLNRCHFGDVRAVLRRMIADGVQVHTIVTSPPYWGLRSYLPAEHPDKAFEIGAEPTIGEFIVGMVEVFDLARQVLRDDGTMWVNMGDSYAASSLSNHGRGKATPATNSRGEPQPGAGWENPPRRMPGDGLKSKDLIGQPWRLAFALQDAGWWLRQDIIWHKPNPMPESIKDRCTKAHEYVFLLSKSERYHFDHEAIKEQGTGQVPGNVNPVKGAIAYGDGDERLRTRSGLNAYADRARSKRNSFARETKYSDGEHGQKPQARPGREDIDYFGERHKRSVWTVATAPYKGAHFATFPPALIEPCILAGAPGGGIVLDPFFGSGTTGQVAQQLGRNFIGIELNAANDSLQAERLRQASLRLEAA